MAKAIGLITANYSTKFPSALTDSRPVASVPFLGRYRAVDFALSNIVNCGIRTVGMIMPYNYRSLIDHVGSGREWELTRKGGGLFILPGSAFGTSRTGSRFLLRDLIHNKVFLERDTADYVILSTANWIYNMDYNELIDAHAASGADITVLTQAAKDKDAAVKAALAPRLHEGEIRLDDFELSEETLRSVNKIVITACGSAYYAGCSGRYAIEKLCRIPVQVELASELRYSDPMVDEHTLVLVISQSGETADTIAALKECKGRGATVLGIVNVVGSTIAKLADHTLYTFAGPEIAVATTKGFTTQLAVLYLFALYAAEKLGRVTPETYAALVRELQHLPRRIQQAIDMNYQLPTVASRYASHSLFFIGRNTDYAVALEGALKMKEISYLHAESYAAGELKHGTIALIEENQPVIAVCCNEALADKTLSNIVEVKARGAKVLALAFKGNKKIVSQADDVIFVPRTETIFSAVLAVVPLQLLAYYAAREKGCDIDKPKNLAKSVTVE